MSVLLKMILQNLIAFKSTLGGESNILWCHINIYCGWLIYPAFTVISSTKLLVTRRLCMAGRLFPRGLSCLIPVVYLNDRDETSAVIECDIIGHVASPQSFLPTLIGMNSFWRLIYFYRISIEKSRWSR